MVMTGVLLIASEAANMNCYALPQDGQNGQIGQEPAPVQPLESVTSVDTVDRHDWVMNHPNVLGLSLVKNVLSDQKTIWTSPAHLRWADGTWLFPLATVTAGFFDTDPAAIKSLSTNPTKLNRYVSVSNYGLYTMVGAVGGLYLLGKISHDDHRKEASILAGEAAIDSLAVTTTLKYSFGRARPYQNQQGQFFRGGDSFPSDHAAVAWSVASVIAHEYPGPVTQLFAYGLATAVSASRVMGQQHFPSDVVVGGAIGWLMGREIYRVHHDPDLAGKAVGSLSEDYVDESQRDRRNMGSPSVPLDSWVYPAFERLVALRYVNTAIMGIKPWTRMECARLTEEAGEALEHDGKLNQQAAELQARLQGEFAYELNLLGGGHNLTANLESVYARGVSISGPPLTDSYHFGQTISYDFGRPFERGTNAQAGGSFSASAGPLVLYVRAEYQHAPSAPAPSAAVLNIIALRDLFTIVPTPPVPPSAIPTGPVRTVNRPELLDAYIGVNLGNWQLTLGRQSLSWTTGPDGSMLFSNNIQPVNMIRLVDPEPVHLPGFLRRVGPVRLDQFFGRLGGHPYFPRPFIYGQKFSMRPFSFLELGLGRTVMIGAEGSDPLNTRNLIESFFGQVNRGSNSVPGHNQSELDWIFYVPKVRNYVLLYGDSTAPDDILPIQNPARNPWHPGIYITRVPGIPKLDFHLEGVSTEQNGLVSAFGGGNHGVFNYWNESYPDGYTNYGNLIGNAVGREGRTIQWWATYWLTSRNTLQFVYKHNTVSSDFIPGGGAWQDYALKNETYLRNGFYVKSELQYEHISRYPVLFNGPQSNVTAIVEMGFTPERNK
jgi:membrane-associated phospholipid phosphatase